MELSTIMAGGGRVEMGGVRNTLENLGGGH